MLSRLRNTFRPAQIVPLHLVFETDLDDAGHHLVRVYKVVGERKLPAHDISQLMTYGYREEVTGKGGMIIHVLAEADQQTLLALKSLNPIVREDSTLEFEIEPTILTYLRRKPNLQETEQAQQVQILDQLIKPAAQIDYTPEEGMKVKVGYCLDGKSITPASKVKTTQDGRYVRQGQNFVPIAKVDQETQALLKKTRQTIPPDQIPEFVQGEMQAIKKNFTTIETENAQQVRVIEEPLRPSVEVDYQPGEGLRVETGYRLQDGKLVPADQLEKTRDGNYVRVGSTYTRLGKVSDRVNTWLEQPVRVVPIKNIPEFFLRDLVLLMKEFNGVLTDLAKQIRIITDPLQPVVHVHKDPQGWLDFYITYEAKGFVLPPNLLPKRGAQKTIQIDPNTWVTVDPIKMQEIERKLAELAAEPIEGGYRLPASEFASLEEFIAAIGGKAELDKAYKEFLKQLTGFKADENFRFPDKFEDHLRNQRRELYPYQKAGIHWLNWLQTNHLHGVLADDMGLGKTIQSLCAMRLAYENTQSKQHSLIIAPKSVLLTWYREIQRVFPYIRTNIYHGPNRQTPVFSSSYPYIIITTYETVARDIELFARVPFLYLILDEATKIKNPDARRTQAIKALNAAHRLALSGTPVENRPMELWSLFDFLMRGHLGKYGTFQRVFDSSIMEGDKQTSERLGRRIKPFILRRKKEVVAPELPPKVPITEWCELTKEQRKLYGALQDEFKGIRASITRGEYVNYATNILPVLVKLKQICDHPALVTEEPNPLFGRSEKYDWIMEKIDEILEQGEQVVVFSHFLGMLDLIARALKEKNIRYIAIQGSTNNRQELIDKFNNGEARVAVLSLLAAGLGITMTAANHVIHADRWWNPAIEDQATDRVHRIGQSRTVFVYQILVQGTLEEKIDRLLEKKRGMADQIMTAATQGSFQWSREELLELLKPLD